MGAAVGEKGSPVSTAAGRTLVSVVVPLYNEALALPELIGRLRRVAAELKPGYDFEFIVVDDGSRDDSLSVAIGLMESDARLQVVQLRRNYGQTAALQAGFDHAAGDIVISMDGDLQHFPEDIPLFLEKIAAGDDVVCGWRAARQEGINRRWPSKMANVLIRSATGLRIHDVGTTFRAYRREILEDIRLFGENHRFIPVFASFVGAKIGETSIRNIERPIGQSNYGLGRSINVLVDICFIFFYARYLDRPIRFFGKISLLTFLASAIVAAVLFYIWATTGRSVVRDHSGWFIVGVMLCLTSIQLMLAGLLAELMARIYFASRKDRSYQLRKVWRGGQG